MVQNKVLHCTDEQGAGFQELPEPISNLLLLTECLGEGFAAQAGHFAAWRAMVHRQTIWPQTSPSHRHWSALQRQCPQTGLFHVICNAVRLPTCAAERTVALLAFENAASSPVADLMDAAQRQKTASEVNAAILKSQHQVGPALIIHW